MRGDHVYLVLIAYQAGSLAGFDQLQFEPDVLTDMSLAYRCDGFCINHKFSLDLYIFSRVTLPGVARTKGTKYCVFSGIT